MGNVSILNMEMKENAWRTRQLNKNTKGNKV